MRKSAEEHLIRQGAAFRSKAQSQLYGSQARLWRQHRDSTNPKEEFQNASIVLESLPRPTALQVRLTVTDPVSAILKIFGLVTVIRVVRAFEIGSNGRSGCSVLVLN
jgi:hypothetical protein